jgi:O-antigen/teichoic acid export membrane protein
VGSREVTRAANGMSGGGEPTCSGEPDSRGTGQPGGTGFTRADASDELSGEVAGDGSGAAGRVGLAAAGVGGDGSGAAGRVGLAAAGAGGDGSGEAGGGSPAADGVSGEASGERGGSEGGSGLGRLVRRGLGWSLFSTLIARVGTVLSGIILARLLSPADYGEFAVALVAMMVVVTVNDLGMVLALVRWPGPVDKAAPTANTLLVGFGFLLCGVMALTAPAFAAALGAPQAAGVVRLMAVSVVVNALFAVPSAMLTRSFRQGQRATADLAGFVVSLAVSVALAALGYGAWSLAWGRIAGNAVNGLLYLVLSPDRYGFGWSRDEARTLFRQGLPISGTTLLMVALLNVDYAVVGRTLGAVELGLYLMAFNLSSWPVNMFSVAVAQVSVPAFARLQHHLAALREAFFRSLTLIMTPTVLVTVLLVLYARPVVRILYGPTWTPAAAALALLAVLGAARVGTHLATDLLVAVGRSRATLVIQVVWILALVPALAAGSLLAGIRGAAAAHVVVVLAVTVPAYLIALRGLGVTGMDVGRALARPAVAAGVAACAGLGVRALVHHDVLVLVLGGLVVTAVFITLTWPLRHLVRDALGQGDAARGGPAAETDAVREDHELAGHAPGQDQQHRSGAAAP